MRDLSKREMIPIGGGEETTANLSSRMNATRPTEEGSARDRGVVVTDVYWYRWMAREWYGWNL